MQYAFFTLLRLSPRLLISLIFSVLIHVLILFGLSGKDSQLSSSLLQSVGKQVLTVDLQSKPKDNLSSPVAFESKTERHLLSESLSNNGNAKINKKSLQVSQADLSDKLQVLPDPPYYTLAELDQVHNILEDVSTNPPELLGYTQVCELTIRLWIDEKGVVVKTEIVKSELPEAFDKSALNRFLNAKF